MRQTVEKLKTAVDSLRERIGHLYDKISELDEQIEEVRGLIDDAVIDSTLPSPAVEVVTDDNGHKRLEYRG
jgi:chaperonin cofactor prefoldin